MPTTKKHIKVFIASPNGLADERRAFREEIAKYNESLAKDWGVDFEAVGCEDTLGEVGRPQEQINEDIRNCDYIIIMFWDWWGSSPDYNSSLYTSGTEEEYYVAMDCFESEDFDMKQIAMMFKGVEPRRLKDQGTQLEQVIKFKEKMDREKPLFYKPFDSTDDFRKLVRNYLGKWFWNEVSGTAEKIEAQPVTGLQVGPDLEMIPKDESAKSANMALVAEARKFEKEGRPTEAEVEFAKATIGQNQPEPIIEFGNFLARIGRLDQAIAMYEKAASLADDQGDQKATGIAYRRLGNVLRTRGDLAGAEEMYNKSLDIEKNLGRLDGMAASYGNLGNVLKTRGELAGAEEMYNKSLEIYMKLKQKRGMAICLGNLGLVLKTRGNLDGAEEMYRKSLEINEELGREKGMASQYGNLGIVLQDRGDLDGAEEMYHESLTISEKLGYLEGMTNAFGNLGTVLQLRGDLDGAEKMYNKVLEKEKKLGRLEGMANAFGSLGNNLAIQGKVDEALEMHRKALDINEQLGSLEGMAIQYTNLGSTLLLRGDLDGAEPLYRKGLGFAEQLGSASLIEHIKSLLDRLHEAPAEAEGEA